MHQDILEAIKVREEKITFAGHVLVVREASNAAEIGQKGDADIVYRLMVACLFEEDGQTPALSEADITALKAGGRKRVGELVDAVLRVNGLNAEEEVKKPEAGPAGASSST